jgi:hypothetical protein
MSTKDKVQRSILPIPGQQLAFFKEYPLLMLRSLLAVPPGRVGHYSIAQACAGHHHWPCDPGGITGGVSAPEYCQEGRGLVYLAIAAALSCVLSATTAYAQGEFPCKFDGGYPAVDTAESVYDTSRGRDRI